MALGSAASGRILVPAQGFRLGRTGGQLLWKRLIDDWRRSGLPILTEDEYPLPSSLGDRPLALAVWYWARFGASRDCLAITDHAQSGRLGLLLRTLRHRPNVRILTVVNHLNDTFRYDNPVYTKLARGNESAMLRLADRIIVHTRTVADSVLDRGVDDSRLTIIPAGTDRVEGTLSIRELGPEEPLRLLWIGGDFLRKGLFTLLRALSAVPPPGPTVSIVGRPHTPAIRQRALEETTALGLGDRVTYLGQVPDGRLADLWYEHDVYVQPSLLEGHGSALDEALVRGMPCVASDLPVFKERLGEGDVEWFPTGDAQALAAALAKLRSGTVRKRLAAAARARAVTFPSWADTLAGYLTVVREEMGRVFPA